MNEYYEDKQQICTSLCETLKLTSQYEDLERLIYTKNKNIEEVAAVFSDGNYITINVSWDSGDAMIRDILKALK